MSTSDKKFAPIYTRAYLASGFREVLFPINVELLLRRIHEAGYAVARGLPGGLPFRMRPEVEGAEIARKGDFSLSLSSGRGNIGISGPNPEAVVEEFESLLKFLETSITFPLEQHAAFHEFLAEGFVQTGESPLAVFEKVSAQMPIVGKLHAVAQQPIGVYGLRLVRPSANPNSPEWFELTVEPEVRDADQTYVYSVIFRGLHLNETGQFAKSFTRLLSSVIRRLEAA